MKKRKREKNYVRNRSGGLKRKLPGRLLSLICALILVLSTVFLDLGHISRAYASDEDLYLETESEETEDVGAETQTADTEDNSEINSELSEDTSEDSNEVVTEEAEDAVGADFSSGDNQDEQQLTTEEGSEISDDSEAQTIAYTQLINDDTVEVRAEAPEGALPEGAELVVKPITNTTDDEEETQQYTDVQNKLIQQAQDNDQDLCGFLAYDISFVDSEGQKVEPAADVKVSMNYKEAAIPDEVTDAVALSADEAADTETTVQTPKVEVLHFVEDQNGEVQDIVNMTQKGQANVETTSDGQVQKAEFNTGSFSVFTITWIRKNTTTGETFSFSSNINMVRKNNTTYVDLSAQVNDGQLTLETEDTNPVLYMSSISSSGPNKSLYSVTENGTTYRFAGAYLATASGSNYILVTDTNNTAEKITKLMGRKEANSDSYVMKYQYKGDTSYRDIKSGQKVVFVYTDAALTTKAGLYSESGTKLTVNSSQTVDLSSLEGTLNTKTANGLIPATAQEDSYVSYDYLRTVVGEGDEAIEIKYLRKGDFGLQYSEDGETWIDVGSSSVKFVYGIKDSEKSAIATADTKDLIDIDLINYNTGKTYDSSFKGNQGSSPQKWYSSFKFGNGREEWTGSSAVTQGLVKSTLGNDGYPVLNNGTSLNKLFNGTWSETIKNTYVTGLNHLFTYNEATGEYSYDSDTNYAYYDISSNNTEKNFIVYNKSNYKSSEGKHQVGAFMPFASWTDTTFANRYAFGMRVAFDFMQPKGGKINGNDMIFSFSGDDDVWVFVDNKLVLDLGGVHDMSSGSINFRTGEVKVNGSRNTTLQNIFGSTFSDYSSHTLKFFYLERGQGESNCSLKFNLPPRPTNSIEIAKKLANSDKEKYTSADFQFKAYLEDDEDKGQFNAIAEGTPFKVKKNGVLTGETRYVGEHNIFTLKAGESAVFEGIDSGLKFYAEEVGILSDQFDKVDITGWNVTYHDTNGNSTGTTTGVPDGQKYLARSETKTAGDAAKVEFSNTCNGRNLRELQITKKMKDEITTSDTFSFRVYLSGQNGQLIPYDGSYVVKDSDGNQIRTGTATTKGIISRIHQNETVVIDKLLSGTEFQVTEVDYSSDKYGDPEKKVKEGTYAAGQIKGSDGQLILGEKGNPDANQALVTITNILKVNLKVEKHWVGDEDNTSHGSVYVRLYDKDGNPVEGIEPVELNSDNNFIHIFNNVREDDQIFELRPVKDGERPEFTINEQGYIKAEAGNIITAKANNLDTKYTVSYGDRTTSSDDTIGTVITQPITNTKIVTDLNLFKVEKNTETGLYDAEFSLYRAKDDYTYQESDLVESDIRTAEDGKVTVSNLVPGKYVLKETKAPAGYAIAANVWQVEVTETREVSVKINGTAVRTKKSDNDKTEFLIENTKLYSLPSSGGPGTYMFTISGVAFITAALLLFINNKRKEDEVKI